VDGGLDTTPRASLSALLGSGTEDDDTIDPRGFHAARSLPLITQRAFHGASATFAIARGAPGLQEFTYGVRATTVGSFVLVPAQLDATHDPTYDARSASTTLVVDP
jgi:hypothetical protein